MLNGQLKSFATTSPGPLIRGSSDFFSLYSASAGGPIVCGVLEDCSDCNLGSFISAGAWGGLILSSLPPPPLQLYGHWHSCWGWVQTWSSRSCPLGYRPFSGQTGLMTPPSPTEKPRPPLWTVATPSVIQERSPLGRIKETPLGSFYWFCFSSLISQSQLDRESNSVTCSFGCDLFFFQEWNWSQARYDACQKPYACMHPCISVFTAHPLITFNE